MHLAQFCLCFDRTHAARVMGMHAMQSNQETKAYAPPMVLYASVSCAPRGKEVSFRCFLMQEARSEEGNIVSSGDNDYRGRAIRSQLVDLQRELIDLQREHTLQFISTRTLDICLQALPRVRSLQRPCTHPWRCRHYTQDSHCRPRHVHVHVHVVVHSWDALASALVC
jgi:hypothetical protein